MVTYLGDVVLAMKKYSRVNGHMLAVIPALDYKRPSGGLSTRKLPAVREEKEGALVYLASSWELGGKGLVEILNAECGEWYSTAMQLTYDIIVFFMT